MAACGYRLVDLGDGTPPYYYSDTTGEWYYAEADAAAYDYDAAAAAAAHAHDVDVTSHPPLTWTYQAPGTDAAWTHSTVPPIAPPPPPLPSSSYSSAAGDAAVAAYYRRPSTASAAPARPRYSKSPTALHAYQKYAREVDPVPRGYGSETDSADGSGSSDSDDSQADEQEVLEYLDSADGPVVGLTLRERFIWTKRAAKRLTGGVVSNVSNVASALAQKAVPLVQRAGPALSSVKSAVAGLCAPKTEPLPLPICARSERADAAASPSAPTPGVWTDSRLHFRDADGVVYRAANASRKQSVRGGTGAEPPPHGSPQHRLEIHGSPTNGARVSPAHCVPFYDLSPRSLAPPAPPH